MITTSESRGLSGERPRSAGCSDVSTMAEEMRPRGKILSIRLLAGSTFQTFPPGVSRETSHFRVVRGRWFSEVSKAETPEGMKAGHLVKPAWEWLLSC